MGHQNDLVRQVDIDLDIDGGIGNPIHRLHPIVVLNNVEARIGGI